MKDFNWFDDNNVNNTIWGILLSILVIGIIWIIASPPSTDYSQQDEWDERSSYSRP